jgi:hypothetical protein
MGRYFLILVVLLTFTEGMRSQACGGSVRTIRLEYPNGEKKATTVEYELFYLMPKDDAGYDWKKQDAFISDFLYSVGKAKQPLMWMEYKDGATFFQVPREKAEGYIKAYRLDDFKAIYTNPWRNHGPPQLKGKFADGILRLNTLETDRTTFIMKVSAAGYETQYLLNNFLGGCHDRDDLHGRAGQKIVMKRAN